MSGMGPHVSSVHHTADTLCPKCEITLTWAHHEFIAVWRAIKTKFPDSHISWSYRDQASQEEAFKEGKTKAHFPYSPHNKLDKQGNKCSHAIDLFQITEEHPQGLWKEEWFKEVAEFIQALFPIVIWGGNFKSIHDGDHYEIDFDDAGNPTLPAPPGTSPVIIPAGKRTC
jgi:hypothetical protein